MLEVPKVMIPKVQSALEKTVTYTESVSFKQDPFGKRLFSQNLTAVFSKELLRELISLKDVEVSIKKTAYGHTYLEMEFPPGIMLKDKKVVCHIWYSKTPNRFPAYARYREKHRSKNSTKQIEFYDDSFGIEQKEELPPTYVILAFGKYPDSADDYFAIFKIPDGKINIFNDQSIDCMSWSKEAVVGDPVVEKPSLDVVKPKRKVKEATI